MYKRIPLLVLLLFLGTTLLRAQSDSEKLPVKVGYWGGFAYQAGLKVGAQPTLKAWTKAHKKRQLASMRRLFVGFNLGFYNRYRDHSNILVEAEVGFQTQREGKKFYHGVSGSIGALGRFQIETITYDVSDGSISSIKRDGRSLSPILLNYFLGKDINETWGWYTKVSYGVLLAEQRFPNLRESSGMLFFELGVKINL